MWVFGLLCLLTATTALPAPQSSESADGDESLFMNTIDSGKESSQEENEGEVGIYPLDPIPEPPQLEPIVPPIVLEIEGAGNEVKPESLEDKEEKEKESQKEKEEDIMPEDQKPAVVTLEVNRPSFLANLFSNFPFSWPPSFPSISLPSFNFPSFPMFGGSGESGRIVYPKYYPEIPNYQYVYVK